MMVNLLFTFFGPHNKSYEFLNDKDCPVPTIRIEHQIRVPSKQFFEWLDGLNIAIPYNKMSGVYFDKY